MYIYVSYIQHPLHCVRRWCQITPFSCCILSHLWKKNLQSYIYNFFSINKNSQSYSYRHFWSGCLSCCVFNTMISFVMTLCATNGACHNWSLSSNPSIPNASIDFIFFFSPQFSFLTLSQLHWLRWKYRIIVTFRPQITTISWVYDIVICLQQC